MKWEKRNINDNWDIIERKILKYKRIGAKKIGWRHIGVYLEKIKEFKGPKHKF